MAIMSVLSQILSDLEDPTKVRNDVAFIAGLLATAAGTVGSSTIPATPDAVLIAGGVLLSLGVRLAHTFVHGGVSKAAIAQDGAALAAAVPQIAAVLPDVLPSTKTAPVGEVTVTSVSTPSTAVSAPVQPTPPPTA